MYSWFLCRTKTEYILDKDSEYVSAVVYILKESGGKYFSSPNSGVIFTSLPATPDLGLLALLTILLLKLLWKSLQMFSWISNLCGNSFVLLEFSVTFDTVLQIQILGISLDFSFPPVSFMLKMIMGFFFLAYLYGESYCLIFE